MIKHCPQPSCSTTALPSAMATIRRPQPPARSVKLYDSKLDPRPQPSRTPVFTPSDFKRTDSFKRPSYSGVPFLFLFFFGLHKKMNSKKHVELKNEKVKLYEKLKNFFKQKYWSYKRKFCFY